MIRAVVFDLDGVLVDSEPVWEQVRRGLVAERGGHWAPDAQRRIMGSCPLPCVPCRPPRLSISGRRRAGRQPRPQSLSVRPGMGCPPPRRDPGELGERPAERASARNRPAGVA